MSRSPVCIIGIVILVFASTGGSAAQAHKDQGRPDSSATKSQPADDSLRSIYPNLPPNQDPEAVARGKHLFGSNCAFCHGVDATGGNGGPDLLRSVLVNHDEKGELITPVIREGRQSKGMPGFSLSDAQIADLVAFLHQRNRDARLRFTYTVPNMAIGDAAAGKEYFKEHCGACHSVTGDLAGIAAKYPADELQQRWIDPPSQPAQLTITLPSGQRYVGRLQHVDEFSASLFEAQGTYRSFQLTREARVQITDPLEAHHNLLHQLSDHEMHDVTTYLETLK